MPRSTFNPDALQHYSARRHYCSPTSIPLTPAGRLSQWTTDTCLRLKQCRSKGTLSAGIVSFPRPKQDPNEETFSAWHPVLPKSEEHPYKVSQAFTNHAIPQKPQGLVRSISQFRENLQPGIKGKQMYRMVTI